MNWRQNITVKMVGYLLAASIVPLVLLGVTAFNLAKNIVTQQAEAENARVVGGLSSYLHLYNDQVEDMAANIAGNEQIGNALHQADHSTPDAFSDLKMRSNMGSLLNSYVRVKGLVSIDVFSTGGAHFHVGETLNVSKVDSARIASMLQEAQQSKSPVLWRGIDSNLNTGSLQTKVNSLIRSIQHFSPVTGKSDTVGLLVINLNDEIMRTYLRSISLEPGSQLMQIDLNGNIALHSDSAQFGQPLSPSLLELVRKKDAVRQFELNGEEVLMDVSPSDQNQHVRVLITPRKQLTRKVNELATATLMLIGLGGIIILSLTWHFTRTVVRPIRSVSLGFRSLSEDPDSQHDALPDSGSQDEIGQLVHGYNNHLVTLNAQRVATQELSQSEALLRATETQLRDSEVQLRAILDEMPVGVALVDNNNQVFLRNRRFVSMFGYTQEDVPDLKSWWAKAHPDSDYRLWVQSNMVNVRHLAGDGKEVWAPVVYAVRCKSGETVHVEISGVGTSGGFIVTFVDHTLHQENQRQLEEAKVLAESANRAKSNFLATMSHEIRTPMNGILGMLNLLEHTELSHRQQDYANKAHIATKSLLGIINDILDFSKVEAGKMELDVQPFVLGDVLRDLSVLLSANLAGKHIEILFDIDPTIPDVLMGDAMRLRQVLLNLTGNAIKFTQHGEVVMGIRVVRQEAQTAEIEFEVRDTGIGIAPDKLAYVFDGFSQAESSTTRKFGGTGLGLAISKRLVSLMGGELLVQSTMGQGSRFYFTMTLTKAPAKAKVPQAAVPLAGHLGEIDTRVLVVDDNAMSREILHNMVRAMRWDCDTAPSGEEALEKLQDPHQDNYQVILMDWRMEGMDGWETTRRIRQLKQGTDNPIVIMVSSQGRELLAQKTQRENELIDGYLVKPITMSVLHDAVNEARSLRLGKPRVRVGNLKEQRLAGLRLLVVEDNLLNQQVALELLTRQGAGVEIAAGGIEGVTMSLTSDPPYDAILMDLQMPDIDGLEATRRIRAQSRMRSIPIIAMTANAMASDKEACLEVGMVDHVSKPIDMEELIHSLLLHTRGSAPEIEARAPKPVAVEKAAEHGPPVLDIVTAVARMADSRELYDQIANAFQNDAPLEIKALLEHLQRKEWNDATRCAHTIKGLSATVGAMALSAACARTEKACKAQMQTLGEDPSVEAELAGSLQALELCTQETLALMAEQIERPVEPQNTALEPLQAAERDAILTALDVLANLLQENNMQSTTCSAQIHAQFGKFLGEPLNTIHQEVQQLQFAQALEKTRALLDQLKS